jgi:hypothetical protein
MAAAFRCANCAAVPARCAPCRARRAAAMRDVRAARRAAGSCTECAADPEPGLTLCREHADANNARSAASHRRAAGREAP